MTNLRHLSQTTRDLIAAADFAAARDVIFADGQEGYLAQDDGYQAVADLHADVRLLAKAAKDAAAARDPLDDRLAAVADLAKLAGRLL